MWSRPLRLPVYLLVASVAHLVTSQETNQAQKDPSAPLTIRLTTPPHWEKDCLAFGLDRTNSSSSSLFIPDMGLYISTSVNDLSNETSNEGTQGWINVYGASDMVSWEARELLPGATLHDQRCLYPQVAIIDMKRQSRRLIPLHGKLRIDAYYFLNEENWRLSKSEHEAMLREHGASNNTKRHYAEAVTQFIVIPCRESGCDLFAISRHLFFMARTVLFLMCFIWNPIGGCEDRRLPMNCRSNSPPVPTPTPDPAERGLLPCCSY